MIVKLTRTDNRITRIRSSAIVCYEIDALDDGSLVYLTNGLVRDVRETPDQIDVLINQAAAQGDA